MPLRIFRARLVTGANLVQGLLVVGMFGVFFLGALYLQRTLGYDALQTGLAFLPSTIAMGALSMRFTEPLISRFGAYRTLLPGVVLIGIGLALFVRAPRSTATTWSTCSPRRCCSASARGSAFPALMTLAMSGATPEDAGLASGLVNTSAQVGGSNGLAVLATLSSSRTESLAAAGRTPRRRSSAATTSVRGRRGLRRARPGRRRRAARRGARRSRPRSTGVRPTTATEAARSGLGHDGEEEERGEEREVDAALLERGAPRQHGQRADHRGEGEQDDLGRPEAEHQRAVEPDRGEGDRRDGQPDARDGGAEREVEAGLDRSRRALRTAARVSGSSTSRAMTTPTADCGAPGRRPRPRSPGLDLRQADDRDERDDQQGEADERRRGGRRVGVAPRAPGRSSTGRK